MAAKKAAKKKAKAAKRARASASSAATSLVHLLDVGDGEYGECVLLELGKTRVLIDGGHPEDRDLIASQLTILLGPGPFHVNLLIVSHAHRDHIGCLPKLVDDGSLRADWALVADPVWGWGNAPALTDGPPIDPVIAALREEPITVASLSDAKVNEFLVDAANLRNNYLGMISSLKQAGTTVVRFQRDTARQTELLETFAGVGLELLGPRPATLRAVADVLGGHLSDSVAAMTDAVGASPVQRFRKAMEMQQLGDGSDRIGSLVNAQSIVATFNFKKRRVLLGGDFQFAKLESGVTQLVTERARLIKSIDDHVRTDGPFSFAKLSHHGSTNAVNEEWLTALGATPMVGISTGKGKGKHPPVATLELLRTLHGPDWVRNDRHGAVTIDLATGDVTPRAARNDATPPVTDAVAESAVVETRAIEVSTETTRTTTMALPGGETMSFSVPPRATRVTVTFDLAPVTESAPTARTSAAIVAPPVVNGGEAPFSATQIGLGRRIPRLLFVTNPELLAKNIGEKPTDLVRAMVRSDNHLLVEVTSGPAGSNQQEHTRDAIRAFLANLDGPSPEGIVLLGGYDVIAPYRVNTVADDIDLSPSDRAADDDHFYVWSDDFYADFDPTPEFAVMPISRIVDCHDSVFFINALRAERPGNAMPSTKFGLRNTARPFADGIFTAVPGQGDMRQSAPMTATGLSASERTMLLASRYVYLVLHGAHDDATRYWGEGEEEWPVALSHDLLDIGDDPNRFGPEVVFCGACWGALATTVRAREWEAPQALPPRSPDESIGLAFIRAGAVAFVGSTGLHYSSMPGSNDGSARLHNRFWAEVGRGSGPAEALFRAKVAFAALPRDPEAAEAAVRAKTVMQFNCLGLGW